MGFLSMLFGGGGGAAESIGNAAISLRSAITGDMKPEDRALLESKVLELQSIQNEVNMKEAGHSSVFVAGWRPAIGWICGFGIAYEFVVRPLTQFVSEIYGGPVPPNLDSDQLMALVTAMLGLGIYRTVEKSNGSNKRH